MRKILSKLYSKLILSIVRRVNKRNYRKIPTYKLDKIHVENTRILTNREDLLKHLPKNGVVAELGVDKGDFSEQILKINTPKTLHLVDSWGTTRYNQNKREKVENRFKNNDEVIINVGLSTDVVNTFPDDYFDWIYIDTAHSYDITISELKAYESKMKQGGIIAGHDYIVGNWNGMIRYGVIEAVYEFCVKHNWEIIYLTTEIDIFPSFAIRKLKD